MLLAGNPILHLQSLVACLHGDNRGGQLKPVQGSQPLLAIKLIDLAETLGDLLIEGILGGLSDFSLELFDTSSRLLAILITGHVTSDTT